MSEINHLWESRDEKDWLEALALYWRNPTVLNNLNIERFMDNIGIEYVKGLDSREWYEFLEKYFIWKFRGNYLEDRLTDLRNNSEAQLSCVKSSLIALDDFDLVNARKCLKLVKSPQVKGLGYPGASGLLSLLFKEWFGTVDKFVVEALYEIESLPERQRIGEIQARLESNKGWNESDAALLTDIMRRKARKLSGWFRANKWTPRNIDMILWTLRGGKSCRK